MSLFNKKIPDLPEIPEKERTPLVNEILETCFFQKEQLALKNEIIQALKDEIARLKGEKPKPDIKPSNLEKGSGNNNGSSNNSEKPKKRPGSKKRKKNRHLKIHDTISISPVNIPEGSRFKGYDDYIVQDLVIKPYNIRFRMQRWQTPSGEYITGKLPEHIKGHYNINIVRYILHQYYHADVTQPLILEQLLELGIDISSGQVNRIINENKDIFHAEKDEILTAGLEVSDYVHVDDTGARHQGRNGYCTHIGNELFAWFESTQSKSRINFLTLLRGKHTELLLVLQRPEIPLHNNLSENDIRGYVKKKKISGGTRSEVGRRCRDTFSSLKKTCRKLGISFWDYLKDRLSGSNTIPQLSDCIRHRVNASPG